MARRISQSEPALAIDFFSSGFYTYRSQLFAPFKGIGVNVVQFHDPVIDGQNFELTDKLQWTRRNGFSIFCPTPLADTEVVNQFYSFRLLSGQVLPFVDTTTRLATFSSTGITTIFNKTTAAQGYVSTIGNMTYFADSGAMDYFKYDSTNVTAWGLAAPTIVPTPTGLGFWQPLTGFAIGNTILDTNGNIESVSVILASNGAIESPTAFSTVALAGGVGTWTGSVSSGGTLTQTLNSTGYTNYLFFQNLNLAIPTNATIVGVVAQVPKKASAGIINDESVKLVIGGSVVGTEHASVADWNTSSLTNFVYGGPLDTWDTSLTPAQANTNGPSGFGLAIAANVVNTNLFTLVQSGTAFELMNNVIFTFPHAVQAGDTIVVGVGIFHETFVSLTDNLGNTYHLAHSSTSGELTNYVYYASNVAAGTTTLKVTIASPASNAFASLNAHEFSGILAVSPVDAVAGANGGGVPFNSGTVTTSDANDLLFTFIYADGGGAAQPAGYTEATTVTFSAAGNTQQFASAFEVVDSTGSYSPQWSFGSVGVTVALKSAGVGIPTIGGGVPSAPVITIYYRLSSGTGGPGRSGLNEPIWATTTGQTVNDGGLTWTNYGPINTWYPLTNYPTPVVVLDLNGNLQLATAVSNPAQEWNVSTGYTTGEVVLFGGSYWISVYSGTNTGIAPNSSYSTTTTTGGVTTTVAYWAPTANPATTGIIAPVWNTAVGGFTEDGSYTWLNIGSGNQLASVGYGYVYAFRTIYGHLSTASPFSNNTGAILGPLAGSITGFAISGDVVTFQGNNSFQVGDTFEVSGLTTGTYLNTQTLTVTSAVSSAMFPLTQVQVNGSNVVTVTAINNLVVGETVTFTDVSNATFLNGETVTVLSSGLSNTQFEFNLTTGSYDPTADTGNVSINGSWTANFTYADVGETADSGVAIPIIATLSGMGTASLLCNSTASITSVSVLANIVTIEASNNFQPGLWVTLTGLTNAIFLNDQQLQVIAVDQLIGTQNTYFQVYFENPNYSPTADIGTATFNAVEIYRTSDGGGTYLFAGAVTNPGAGIIWDFSDFTIDADLDILLIAPLAHQNDPPPGAPGSTILTAGSNLIYWQSRLWMAVGNYVYFDAGSDCTNGIPEESWPPANRFQFAGPVLGLVPTPDGAALLVYLADRVASIQGGPETISFYAVDAFSNFGVSNPNALFKDGSTLGQFTTQGQYFEITQTKTEIGEHIADYLVANFAPAKTYATMHRNGLDVGVFLSNGVDRVLRYGTNIGAWSLPAFPAFGAGACRSIETSVGVTTLMLAAPKGGATSAIGPMNPESGVSAAGTGTAWLNPGNITAGSPSSYATVTFSAVGSSQILRASNYALNAPSAAVVQGVQVSIVGKQSEITGDLTLTITPTNAVPGAESHTFSFGTTNTTVSYGSTSDLWNMPWSQPYLINGDGAISFDLVATFNGVSVSPEMFVAEVQITVTYQSPGNYLYARDLNSWGDDGVYGANNGTPYGVANVVIGSISLSQLGAVLMPLQHFLGYFDAVGTLDNGGPSIPNVWILPNEVNATAGVGFIQLPEALHEPPQGQTWPSKTILARRWPLNMMNSSLASQFIHHIQVNIEFSPENAPNTIKAVAFSESQN